ncbi:TPA: DUF4825 domain-containing protein [Streptococcus suis]|nr:DUF4825 domain-containing protein [Streptococcus suis]
MRRIRHFIFVVAGLSVLTLTACQSKANNSSESLEDYRTEYIGDNSNVIKIASFQDYPTAYRYDHIEIDSDEKPYELRIFLKVSNSSSSADTELQKNRDSIFDLIANLDHLTFVDADTGAEIISYTRE